MTSDIFRIFIKILKIPLPIDLERKLIVST